MQSHNTLLDIFIAPLNKANIKYMVTGSVASICYGEPRMTHDIDLVVMLTDEDISNLARVFPEENFYLPPPEVMQMEKNRSVRGHFNIIHFDSAFKADIYFTGNEQLLLWGMKNRKRWSAGNAEFWIAPPEYVIVKKLHYWAEGHHQKHLDDIQAMLQIQGDSIVTKEILDNLSSEMLQSKFTELVEGKNKTWTETLVN